MKRLPASREHGVSLVELMLGLAITALVLAPLVPMIRTASAAARLGGEQVALEQEADFAVERIAARIRATPPAQLTGPSSGWLLPATYTWTASTGTLAEQQQGASYTLAESVTAFGLAARASEGGQPMIEVNLTLKRGDAVSSASAIVRMGGMP